jgi:calcium-dependent protein kinase
MGVCVTNTKKKPHEVPALTKAEKGTTIVLTKDMKSTDITNRLKKQLTDSKDKNENLFLHFETRKVEDDYDFIKQISDDKNYTIWKVQHKQTRFFRILNLIKGMSRNLYKESDILTKLDCPYIIKIYDSYNSENGLYYLTEYCKHGHLLKQVMRRETPLSERKVAFIMFQILSAVSSCHSYRIIHRNLLLENILIHDKDHNGDYYIKLSNFKTARLHNNQTKMIKKVKGGLYYIAPEVLEKSYNEKCDIWSCGVIMYSLLSGKFPFEGKSEEAIMEKIKKGKFDILDRKWEKISFDAKDLINELLNFDFKKRITAKNALKHKWFENFKIKHLLTNLPNEKITQLINNLENINSQQIQLDIASYIIHNYSHLNIVKEAIKLFQIIDEDNDGKLSKQEVYHGLKVLTSKENLDEKVNEIFSKHDVKTGYIRCEEFIRACADKTFLFKENRLEFALMFVRRRYYDNYTLEDLKKLLNLETE